LRISGNIGMLGIIGIIGIFGNGAIIGIIWII
jgi:hypothetical protein